MDIKFASILIIERAILNKNYKIGILCPNINLKNEIIKQINTIREQKNYLCKFCSNNIIKFDNDSHIYCYGNEDSFRGLSLNYIFYINCDISNICQPCLIPLKGMYEQIILD